MDPGLLSLLAGGVSSFFGKKPKYDENQLRQMEIAKQFQEYGNAAPGSDPRDQALLAQLRAQLGAEQGMATNQLLAAQPVNARTNQADMLRNLGSSQAAERANLDMQALLEAYGRQRQALLQSAQISGAVGQKRQQGQNDLPALFGQYAYMQAQRQAMKQGQGGGQGTGDAGGYGAALDVAQGGPQQFTPQSWQTAANAGAQAKVPIAGLVQGPPTKPAQPSGFLNAFNNIFGAMRPPAAPTVALGRGPLNTAPFEQTLPVGTARPAWGSGWPGETFGQAMLAPDARQDMLGGNLKRRLQTRY